MNITCKTQAISSILIEIGAWVCYKNQAYDFTQVYNIKIRPNNQTFEIKEDVDLKFNDIFSFLKGCYKQNLNMDTRNKNRKQDRA